MLNAYHYGISIPGTTRRYAVLSGRSLPTKNRTVFGDLLCAIFKRSMQTRPMPIPQFEPRFQISIYDVLFAFLSYVRKLTDAKHYKVLRREFAKEKDRGRRSTLPIYLLKPFLFRHTSGYLHLWIRDKNGHGEIKPARPKPDQGVRNKQRKSGLP